MRISDKSFVFGLTQQHSGGYNTSQTSNCNALHIHALPVSKSDQVPRTHYFSGFFQRSLLQESVIHGHCVKKGTKVKPITDNTRLNLAKSAKDIGYSAFKIECSKNQSRAQLTLDAFFQHSFI